jgi:hypothetical protein
MYPCDLCGSLFSESIRILVSGSHQNSHMARKKRKPKPFRAVTAIKELARERVGAPPPEKIVIEKKKKPEKHKPTLERLLNESE